MTLASDVEVAVVGAGAAGIGAARRLVEHGRRIVVLEARDRVGGRALTIDAAIGVPVDLGCEWLHSADRNSLTRIARAQGIAIDERLPEWGARLERVGASPADCDDWRRARTRWEATMAEAAAGPDRPALSLMDPGARWTPLMDAISTWANGVPLSRLSVRDYDRYQDSGINWRLPDGYGRLIASQAQGLPVALEAPVEAIDHRGRRIRIHTARGTVMADAAVVTLPTPLLADDAIRFDPPLPAKQSAAAGVPLGVANKLFLALDGALPGIPDGSHLLGATDRSATASYEVRPHGRPLIAVYFGGELATALEAGGMAAMAAFAVDELTGLIGSDVRRRLRPLAASAWAGDRWARGSYSAALPGRADDRAVLAAPVDNRLFFAGEACAPGFFSTAHGAYDSGTAAADAAHGALAA